MNQAILGLLFKFYGSSNQTDQGNRVLLYLYKGVEQSPFYRRLVQKWEPIGLVGSEYHFLVYLELQNYLTDRILLKCFLEVQSG